MRSIKFIWSLLRHKWFVFLAGIKIGVPIWRLIIHDFSKFSAAEFWPYVNKFITPEYEMFKERTKRDFTIAWLYHENRNDHHWGHWMPRSGDSQNKPLEMPEVCAREMVADWHGASRAYTGSWHIAEWLAKNTLRMEFHPATTDLIHDIMIDLGYVLTDNCPWSFAWLRQDRQPIGN